MNLEKKKNNFIKRLVKAKKGDVVKVINFKRKDFKKEMSTSVGFGWQDLNDDPKAFYKWLLISDYNIHMIPTTDETGFGVKVTMIK